MSETEENAKPEGQEPDPESMVEPEPVADAGEPAPIVQTKADDKSNYALFVLLCISQQAVSLFTAPLTFHSPTPVHPIRPCTGSLSLKMVYFLYF